MNERNDPYRQQAWANTQKHMLHLYKERFELMGAIIGPDEEFAIVRMPVDGLPEAMRSEYTVEANTGLNIMIEDTRAVVALKLTDVGDGAGDVIQEIDSDGVVGAKLTSGGTFTNRSLAIFKDNMKDLTEKQIGNILENAKVYRFNYLKEPDVIYVSPEAAEFNALTGWGDGTTIAPGSISSIALRLVQWVWNKVKGFEERLTALEAQSALQQPPQPPPEDTESS